MSKKIYIFICSILSVFLASGFYSKLEVTKYEYINPELPDNFDEFRIAHITDLHCKKFGSHQKDLLEKLNEINPDVIFLTGDMIDGNHKSIEPVKDLIAGAANIAPIYAVSGNHESDNSSYEHELNNIYREYNVKVLDSKSTSIHIGSDSIYIYGSTKTTNFSSLPKTVSTNFNILLYHYSNLFDSIPLKRYNLIFSGHTHGGIIRIPFVGGLLGNDGSLFPKYDSGLFTKSTSTMISSRGLGQSFLPRFFNRPELVLTVLKIK